MFKCCPFLWFLWRHRRKRRPSNNGEPLLLSNKEIHDEGYSSPESAGHTPRRETANQMESTREDPTSFSTADPSGFASLHFTRLSCQEEQYSWQVRTAIELDDSLDPLILTAIEKEESVEEREEETDPSTEGGEEEMVTAVEWMESGEKEEAEEGEEEMLMMTAVETIEEKDEKTSDDMEGEDGDGERLSHCPFQIREHPLNAEMEGSNTEDHIESIPSREMETVCGECPYTVPSRSEDKERRPSFINI